MKITIEWDSESDDICELANAFDSLSTAIAATPAGERLTGSVVELDPAEQIRQVRELFHQLGTGSRGFLIQAVRYLAGQDSFTFNELASELGEEVSALRSYHRNMHRTIKGRNLLDPFANSNWDDTLGANHYRIPDFIRDEILRLADELERQA